MDVFDRNAKKVQRERAAAVSAVKSPCVPLISSEFQAENVKDFDYMKEEMGYRLADRVLDINRRLDTCVDIGSGRGFVTRHLSGRAVKKVFALEMSPSMLDQLELPDAEEVSGLICVAAFWNKKY